MKDDYKLGLIVLPICFVVLLAIHFILGVPRIINALAPGPVLDSTMWFEYLSLAAIFTGILIDHIAHMMAVVLPGAGPRESHGLRFRDFFLGIGALSFSGGVYYFLQSVAQ